MKTLLGLVLCLSLAGCAFKPMDIEQAGGEDRISPGDVVPVALGPGIADRVDKLHGPLALHVPVQTGKIWARLFVGPAGAKDFIEIESSDLLRAPDPSLMATRYTYTAIIDFHFRGTVYRLTAKGTRAAALQTFSAMRQAIELGADDAAKQVSALMAKAART